MGQVFLWLAGAIALFAGGAGLGYWLASFSRERKRADALQQDLDQYRDQVNQHFAQTAEHFRTIGREYRALYDHMASGAETLCDPQAAAGRLSFAPAPPGDEDESTPDERARGLGGESAPSEDDGETAEAAESADSGPSADADQPSGEAADPGETVPRDEKPVIDAQDAAAGEPLKEPSSVAAEAAETANDDREPTYH